jgi:hypothetical protein
MFFLNRFPFRPAPLRCASFRRRACTFSTSRWGSSWSWSSTRPKAHGKRRTRLVPPKEKTASAAARRRRAAMQMTRCRERTECRSRSCGEKAARPVPFLSRTPHRGFLGALSLAFSLPPTGPRFV